MKRYASSSSSIKRAQRESTIKKIVGELMIEVTRELPALEGLFVNRVELSPGKSVCYVYLYSHHGKEHFMGLFEELKLFKPSIRKSLADSLPTRYAADIVFHFDEQLEKSLHLEALIDAANIQDAPLRALIEDDEPV
jgi:ribosome-binding factor A